jgi:hypothetical protein
MHCGSYLVPFGALLSPKATFHKEPVAPYRSTFLRFGFEHPSVDLSNMMSHFMARSYRRKAKRERYPGSGETQSRHNVESKQPSSGLHYQYDPLDMTKQQIRLLRLLSSDNSYEQQCKISIFDMSDLPSYIALWYAWDEDTRPKGMILLNGKPCGVGLTLCAFFQNSRESYGNTDCPWLWIDQLCINQSEVRETELATIKPIKPPASAWHEA